MIMTVLRCFFLLSLLTTGSASPKYFAFYDDDPNVTAAFTNLRLFASTEDAIEAKKMGLDSLLNIYSVMWESGALHPDWQSRWNETAVEAKQLLKNGTIIGFNLGDELVWNCLSPEDLETGANAVRTSFPRGEAIIWYNEATGPVASNQVGDGCKNKNIAYKIPSALDWFSIDMYHMDGEVDSWVNIYPRSFYQKTIYPNLTDSQKVLLVPGSFGSVVNHYPNGTYICDQHCYDVMCAHDAQDFWTWAKEDPRVVAIAPWNWGGCESCNGSRWTPPHTCCMDEIGTKDQPLTRSAWEVIGKAIKQPSLFV